eukprot:495994_1
MLKAFIQNNTNHHFCCSLHSIIKSTNYRISINYHSKLYCSSTTDTNTQSKQSNQITLDYATLFQYVRPEMVQRIQQVIDHESYLTSLSQQIHTKQLYQETLEKKQKHKQPQLHNQKVSKEVFKSLTQVTQGNNDAEEEIMYEPGLDLQELSSLKQFESTFYGPSPLNSFEHLNIDTNLLKVINDIGINMPSHIQQLAIPEILKGNHCVIGSETGTGKTLAFVLPILHAILHDNSITQTKFDPISKFNEYNLSKDNERKYGHKYHPFEFDAEKKYPFVVIIEPNEHLCIQTQKVINEILDRYYDKIYFENRDNKNFYKLKSMSLHGRALLPKSNELMPDILITTPTALITNIHKKHNENRYRSFLSKIKYIVLDEADFLTRTSSRFQLRYLFGKLKELRAQIENNPLKYKLLLPKYIRDENNIASPSLIYRELNKICKPQVIFVGATIPTKGSRNVAQTIREWLDKAVWIRTPGLHNISSHIAQEFRFVPRTMELDILHQVLIQLSKQHFYGIMFETDDDLLHDKVNEIDTSSFDKKHKKRRRRLKKAKNNEQIEWENKQKQLHILVFVNTKKFTRECYKYLLNNGWTNTRCIHSQLHREERKQRLIDFEDGIPHTNDAGEKILKKNILINNEINKNIINEDGTGGGDTFEYKDIANNIHILVTSDFANRGVDFKNVDVIINAQFPNHATDYLHRCGRTGRGGTNTRKDNGRVISFFNEYDLDLAWHIQMSLINQYKNILKNENENENDDEMYEDINRIGTTSVQLDDCFGIEKDSMGEILRDNKGVVGDYKRMSLPRDYQKTIDLTRIDIDDMDEKLLDHILIYAKKEKWINKIRDYDNDNENEVKSDKKELEELIKDRKDKKWKLKVPWPYRLEFASQ